LSVICRRPFPTALLLGVSAYALCTGAALAEPAPPFPDLLRQAQTSAPRLAEARAEVARAEGLARQARAIPNPTLGVEVENFAGSGPFKGTNLAETTATLGQTIELGGKRAARVAVGGADVEAARARATRLRGEFAFDLAAAYALADASERRLSLAVESAGLAQEDSRIASALVEAGREPGLRRLQALAALQAARAAVEEARAARATAFSNLTALAGAPAPITSIPTGLLVRADQVFVASTPDPLASPAYVAAQTEREAAARRIRVERIRAMPDVTVSVGARRFEGDDATAFVAGVSIPFPIFDRNRGNISAAQAGLTAAEARLNAARLEAEAAVRSGSARFTAAETRLRASQESERTAEEAYRLTRLGYEGGKLELVELLNAQRALAEARAQTIDAAVERLSAQAGLARLAGSAPFGEQP
jgi:cobalt-zinc-cadmium efflux system outer membrane protein